MWFLTHPKLFKCQKNGIFRMRHSSVALPSRLAAPPKNDGEKMGVNDVTPRTPAPACVWPMADINANPPVTTGKLTGEGK